MAIEEEVDIGEPARRNRTGTRRVDLRPAGLVLCAAVGLVSTLVIAWSVVAPLGNDWRIMVRATTTDPYSFGTYTYPPVFTILFGALVVPLGLHAVVAAHFLSLALIRDRLVLGLTLLTPAWWMTVALGNVLWFQVLVGYFALGGSRWAGMGTMVAFTLLPRPMFVPLVAWLLWKRADLRLPALAIAAGMGVLNLATGQLGDWLRVALSVSGDYPWNDWNWGPTRLIGSAWLIVGVPLAGWLVYRGRVGWAGLAMSPYVVPPMLLVLLHELRNKVGVAQPRSR